ncbi:MAG: hypothetical protein HY553_14305 [Elusimicrobia bacterium]|nr:hypothetical protein [Elusimicrobiota bacterium]
MRRLGCAAFATPELMPVVAIIGILAAIAIPKFAELTRASIEGATKGNLGAIRSALSIHYGDHEGFHPYHPSALTANGLYLRELPKAKAPTYHPDSAAVRLVESPAEADDAGGWLYVGNPGAADHGSLYVNCTHTDSKGSSWLAY